MKTNWDDFLLNFEVFLYTIYWSFGELLILIKDAFTKRNGP